jgi:all-trans-retinol dehydrogenase (NAD+)
MDIVEGITSYASSHYIISALIGLFFLKTLLGLFRRGKSLAGEVVFITGGASGIGRQMALEFVRQGAKVIIADIDDKRARVVAYECKNISKDMAVGVLCDVTSIESVKAAAEAGRKAFGPITILINNAGIVSGRLITEIPYESIERTFKVNAISHFYTIKEFLPSMLEKNKGHIVTIASVAGLGGVSKMTDYCGSKFAAVGIDDSLRNELKSLKSAVKTTCVCPYYINTGMFKGVTTKFNFLVPMLNEDWVGKRIVKAVKFDEEMLLMPNFMKTANLLKALLPIWVSDLLSDTFGFQHSMNTFQGRHK